MSRKIYMRMPEGASIGFRERGTCSITVWAEDFKSLKIGNVVELWSRGIGQGIYEGDAKLISRHPVAEPKCVCDLHREVLVFAKVKKAKTKKN